MTSTGRRGYVGIDRHWISDPDLSDTALRFMLWLDSHSDEYLAAMNIARSAEQLGWGRNRVKRAIEELEALNLISTEQIERRGGGTVTRFTLHLDEWSAGPRRTSAMVHGDAPAMVHGDAPSTSTLNGEESNRGESVVVDDTTLTEAELLCIQMADAITTWSNDKRPTITKAWVSDMDRLMRLDGRNPHQIERVLKWLYTSPDSIATFWAPNIQSPKKLRAQWIKMAMQYDRLTSKPKHQSDIMNDLDRIRAKDAS